MRLEVLWMEADLLKGEKAHWEVGHPYHRRKHLNKSVLRRSGVQRREAPPLLCPR